MKNTIIKIITLSVVAAVIGWQLGGVFSPRISAMALGAILMLMVAIAAVLIALATPSRVRHDHYVHYTVVEPQKQDVEMPKRPTRYIIVNKRPELPAAAQSKLEVDK